jgi:hypothetical protein
MHSLRFSFFLTLVLALVLPASHALELYVDPQGSDTWTGRLASPNATRTDGPLASLEGARQAVRRLSRPLTEPVQVTFAAGTYRINREVTFDAGDAGESGRTITYAAAAGATVIISGGELLPAWQAGPDGRWICAPAPNGVQLEQLWVNDHRALRARSLRRGQPYALLQSLEEERLVSAEKSADLYEQVLRVDPSDLAAFRTARGEEIGDAVINLFHKWDNTRRHIKSVDLDAGLIVIRGNAVKPHNPLDHHTGFVLENLPALLDEPGEWFHARSGQLTYWPRPDEQLAAASAVRPVAERFLVLAGTRTRPVSHLRFSGLRFYHARGVAATAPFEPNQAAVQTVDGAIIARHARDVVFVGCEVAHVGSYAISLHEGCRRVTIEQCLLTDLGAGGVRIGTTRDEPNAEDHTSHNRVHNSIIRDGGLIYPCAVGIWIGSSSDNEVTHNEVSDLFYSAISVGWRWGYAPSNAKRNRIEWNHLHHLGKGFLSDMGGVYTLGPSEGTSVSHNLIHDVTCFTYGGWGLYTDEGSTGITLEGNVTYNTTDGGFHQHYGRDNVVRNNILAFSSEAQVKRSRAEEHRSFTFERNIVVFERGELLGGNWSGSTANVLLARNLYWNYSGAPVTFTRKQLSLQEWQQTGQDVGSVIADPRFANAPGHDFRLPSDSPAVALGFQPIDVTRMGVEGDTTWRQLAASFKREPDVPRPPLRPAPAVNIRQNFEGRILNPRYPFPHAHGALAERKHGQPDPGDTLALTGAKRSEGRMSLLFRDAPGLSATYYPMLTFHPHHRAGISTVSFDLFLEPRAIFQHEWRDQATPYHTGPVFQIRDGKLSGVKGLAGDVPLGQWVHFEIRAALGPEGDAHWSLRVVPAEGPAREYANLPFRSAEMRTLDWVGFISAANERTEFYLDQLAITTTRPGH